MKDTGLCRRRGCENLRKPLIIVAIVSGYSLLEIGLLLSSIVSHQGYFHPSTYQAVVYLGQILLIPGLAAVFSRIIYGSHEWIRKTVMMLPGGALLGPAAIIVVFAPAVVLAWAFDVSRMLFDLLLPLTLGGMAVGLFLAVRKSGKWAIRAEAARWLAERQSGVDPCVRRWRSRSICAVLWIPLTMVLVVFLFLPEVWGILSHFTQPRSLILADYRVPIPVTWIVQNYQNEPVNGWSSNRAIRRV